VEYVVVAYHKHGKSYLTFVGEQAHLGCKKIATKFLTLRDAEDATCYFQDFDNRYYDIKIRDCGIEEIHHAE
jgi:hypothetical protein